MDYSPWGLKESDVTEQLNTSSDLPLLLRLIRGSWWGWWGWWGSLGRALVPTRRWARGRATGQECRSRPSALLPKQSPASSPERVWGAHSHPPPESPSCQSPHGGLPGAPQEPPSCCGFVSMSSRPSAGPTAGGAHGRTQGRVGGRWPLQPVPGPRRPGPPDLREQSRARGPTRGAGVRLCLLTALCPATARSVLGLTSCRTTDQVT